MPDWLWMKGARAARGEFDSVDDARLAADAPTGRDTATLELRPLETHDRDRYRERWVAEVRADLLVNPAAAVEHADALVREIMLARGYPVDELSRRPGALSVDQASILRRYHEAHRIAAAHELGRGEADVVAHGYVLTDELRHAVQQYRHLFDELVDSADEPIAG